MRDIEDMASTHQSQPLAEPASPAPARRPVRLAAVVLVVVLLLVAAVVGRQLASGDDSTGAQRVSFPAGSREQAVLLVDSGADSIVVTTADLGGDLADVVTPGGEDSGVRPKGSLDGDQLRVWTEDTGTAEEGAAVQIQIRVAAGVRWSVVVAKGAKQVRLVLPTGNVQAVELRGGADLADIALPAPVGEQSVRIPTGLASANLHVPAGVPAKVTFGSGAGRASVDGAEKQGIAAGTTFFGVNGKGGKAGEKGYNAAKDRLTVDVPAGVGALTLDRVQP